MREKEKKLLLDTVVAVFCVNTQLNSVKNNVLLAAAVAVFCVNTQFNSAKTTYVLSLH